MYDLSLDDFQYGYASKGKGSFIRFWVFPNTVLLLEEGQGNTTAVLLKETKQIMLPSKQYMSLTFFLGVFPNTVWLLEERSL